jgi:hypothetical protein
VESLPPSISAPRDSRRRRRERWARPVPSPTDFRRAITSYITANFTLCSHPLNMPVGILRKDAPPRSVPRREIVL